MRGSYEALWDGIKHRLCIGIPDWKQRIIKYNQVTAVEERARGHRLSDDEIFKSLVLAVLSNSANWAIVEKVQPELDTVFLNFRLKEYAALEQSPIRLTISRICQVCGAFSFGDLIETRGDGLAEASDGECAVLERI